MPDSPMAGAPTFDLMLFDLDGTLVLTAPDIADALNALLRDEGQPAVDELAVRGWIGHGTRNLLARALPGRDVEPLLERFAGHYQERCGRRGRVVEGGIDTLRQLRSQGRRLGLLTNKEQRYARWVLEAHGLRDEFDVVVCGDTLPARKPDPLPVRHCLQMFRVAPQRCVLVGDSAIDLQTARNAGVAAWLVPWGYPGDQPLDTLRPDRMLRAFPDLAAVA